VDSNSEIQGYNVYPMLHFCRKFSSGVTACEKVELCISAIIPTCNAAYILDSVWPDTPLEPTPLGLKDLISSSDGERDSHKPREIRRFLDDRQGNLLSSCMDII